MTGTDTTVELFVRSLSPAGARDRPASVVARLESLVEANRIEDYAVRLWGPELPLTQPLVGHERAEALLEEVAAFRSWAADHDVALDAFETREASAYTGETYAALSLPVMALAEYADGELVCVTPCTTEDGPLTVADRLALLEEAPPADGRTPDDGATRRPLPGTARP